MLLLSGPSAQIGNGSQTTQTLINKTNPSADLEAMALQQPSRPLHRRTSLLPGDGKGVERVIIEDTAELSLQRLRSRYCVTRHERLAVPLQLAPNGSGGGSVAEVGLRECLSDHGEPVLEADPGTAFAHCGGEEYTLVCPRD